jgi:valyl-tRNA synthetase
MGHGFQVSIMDAFIRYHRMLGKKVLWQGGTDHAGIATQMVVERQLALKGKRRDQMTRETFMMEVSGWKEQSEQRIYNQLRRLGASIDFSRNRFTQDEGFNEAVLKVFITLYKQGLLYRGKRLVNWDPKLLTAISDLEVIHTEESGSLYYLYYPIVGSSDALLVATTRPETLFGDVAVAVHPDDQRYQHLIGASIQLPLTDRVIPIIADNQVDPEFGTGCVKITPGHDFNDYKIGQRHQLPLISILTPQATLNDTVPLAYRGMDCLSARKAVIAELTALKQVQKVEPHTLKVPRGDRSGAIIEPYLTDQWFMRMKPLAKRAIEAIQSGEVKFVPENWTAVCLQWLENIEDWCISRQLWWGHRIPAWYGPNNEIFVGIDEISIRAEYNLDENFPLTQEEDVLDTWVSSALWPFGSLGWPQSTSELNDFYPTSVLVTGFDIVFFWVARMIMLGLHFMEKVPFSKVYVTGLIRDQQGQKMSKSKGNVLDPLDIIEGIALEDLMVKRTQGLMQPQMAQAVAQQTQREFPSGMPAFGADALRFTYYSLASPTRDIRYDINRTAGYRNFCNKLWQATRFVLTQYDKTSPAQTQLIETHMSIFDRWILSRLQIAIEASHQHFETYRFDLLAQTLYDFVWHDYCDWYLEMTKPVFRTGDTHSRQATRATLTYVLESVVRLLHPLMPFITETLWVHIMTLGGKHESRKLHEANYPEVNQNFRNIAAEQLVEKIQTIIRAIRGLRAELKIAPNHCIPLICVSASQESVIQVKKYEAMITCLAKVEFTDYTLKVENQAFNTHQMAITTVDDIELLLPLHNIINVEDEVRRLNKEKIQLEKSIQVIEKKLANTAFIEKAPAAIVEKVNTQYAQDKEKLELILKQLEVFKEKNKI